MRRFIDELRSAATECSQWNLLDTPPFSQWSDLFDKAAHELEQFLDEE